MFRVKLGVEGDVLCGSLGIRDASLFSLGQTTGPSTISCTDGVLETITQRLVQDSAGWAVCMPTKHGENRYSDWLMEGI